MTTSQDPRVPTVSKPLLAAFGAYVRRYLKRHFHAIRVSRERFPICSGDEPIVVYLNHPSWWDPLIGLQLARSLWRDRQHFAAIDAVALERYGFFRKLGFFGVEQNTRAGARQFLEYSAAVLALDRSTLWLTPEGQFVDPRDDQQPMAPGLAHLARRMERGILQPLALEYPFWEERLPEALARFGEPLPAAELRDLPLTEITERLESGLKATQRELARESIRRDADAFVPLLGGGAGVGGIYDTYKSFKHRLRGESFERSHAAVVRSSALRAPKGGHG